MKGGVNILKLRVSLGLKRKEFADRLNITQAAFSYYENSKRIVPMHIIKRIFDEFNLPKEHFYKFAYEDYDLETLKQQ